MTTQTAPQLSILKLAAAAAEATFAPMTRTDHMVFGGAEPGTLIAQDDKRELTLLLSPEGQIAFIGTDHNGDLYELRLRLESLI